MSFFSLLNDLKQNIRAYADMVADLAGDPVDPFGQEVLRETAGVGFRVLFPNLLDTFGGEKTDFPLGSRVAVAFCVDDP